MRTPILFILIPYILSILIIENKLIQKNYFLVFVSLFLLIFIYKILTNFKTKDLINFCIFISLLINLNSSYNLSINNSYIENPPREIIANVEIKTILNKNGKIYYVAEIVDIKNDKLYNIKRVYLSFSSKINKDIFLKRIKIIGILKKEFRNGYLDMYITRCNILEMPRNSLFQYAIQKVKCYILNIFYNSNKNWSEIGNFQKAIFLGDSSSISKDTLNRFKNSGTLHLFAVSGLHVGLLYIILSFSISFLSKKRFFNEILVVFILFVYLNIVEFPPSAVRAFLMVACWQISKVFFKKSNALSSLFLSAVFVLFLNPYLIMTIGFQLSYTVVLSILVIHLLTTKHIQVQKRNVNLIISYFLTSYAAFCGSTLLVFDNFQLIVPGAILINIIIIPFIFLSQIFIFTNLLISFFFDFSLINYIIEFLYKILLFVLDKFTLENITFIKFDNKLGVNNVVHLIYPFLFFLFFYKKTFLFFNLFLYIVIPLLLIFIF